MRSKTMQNIKIAIFIALCTLLPTLALAEVSKSAQENIRQYLYNQYATAYQNNDIAIQEITLQFPIDIESSHIIKYSLSKNATAKTQGTLIAQIAKNGSQISVPIAYKIEASIKVLRARATIYTNDDINAQNTSIETIALNQLKSAPISPNLLNSVSARSIISPNAIITADKIKDQILVRKGENIAVTLQSEGISIQTTLEALQNGVNGEIIKALNPATKKVLRVKITGIRTGEVV